MFLSLKSNPRQKTFLILLKVHLMKTIVLLLFATIFTSLSIAQELPARSPKAVVNQKVGLSDITIEYSRPSARNRVVYGSLVPYGEVWRLGANECTKITTTKAIIFGRSTLDAGTYAIFAVPQKDGKWNIMFNTDTKQWGTGSYDSDNDVLTTIGGASKCDHVESFDISFNNITNYGATILIKWSNTKVEVPFIIKTDEHVEAEINAAVSKGEELEQVHYKAANYYFQTKKDFKVALTHIEKSLAVKEGYFNLFLKAEILAETGDKKTAVKLAKNAKKMAKEAEKMDWADYIDKRITEWE